MGQISRMARAGQFMDEFEADPLRAFPVRAGSEEEVRVYLGCRTPSGRPVRLAEDYTYFWPDSDDRDDVLGRIEAVVPGGRPAAARRLARAALFPAPGGRR